MAGGQPLNWRWIAERAANEHWRTAPGSSPRPSDASKVGPGKARPADLLYSDVQSSSETGKGSSQPKDSGKCQSGHPSVRRVLRETLEHACVRSAQPKCGH